MEQLESRTVRARRYVKMVGTILLVAAGVWMTMGLWPLLSNPFRRAAWGEMFSGGLLVGALLCYIGWVGNGLFRRIDPRAVRHLCGWSAFLLLRALQALTASWPIAYVKSVDAISLGTVTSLWSLMLIAVVYCFYKRSSTWIVEQTGQG